MTDDEEAKRERLSELAAELGAAGASKGGKARAAKMTPEERSEVAKKAAATRWEADQQVQRATHVGTLKIGDREIACAVLADGKRVLTQETFLEAIGRNRAAKWSKRLDAGLPPFLASDRLKPFVSNELGEMSVLVPFHMPRDGTIGGGKRGHGYDARILPMVCEVYLKARDVGALTSQQEHVAAVCEILVRGLAVVGIVALVDEATGYQEDRVRNALVTILEAFINSELAKWVKTFPNAFYKEIFRLRGWEYTEKSVRRPCSIGRLTNDLVYERLASGVLDKLREITPRTPEGHRKHRYHQRLTQDVGYPALREHLASLTALMRASDDWRGFEKLVNRSLPRLYPVPLFEKDEDCPPGFCDGPAEG